MTLEEQISDLAPASLLADLLRQVTARRSVETAREAGYISVRPVDRAIAAYVNRQFLDIAVDPLASERVAVRVGASSIKRKTTATHYVRVPAENLEVATAIECIFEALDWRETGPRWSGGSGASPVSDLAGEVCGTCFLVVAAAGACGCD